ncbi:uncharacterized protein Bfra_002614 [Botrytis fragariae]|uniref:Uncharacterized protein n=1 Tax=Botrytis fragariae TaxID=1964551 RepID=A0A8H6EL28_9HELO|nr:uncharacterized protein Bfra_002614 [Botrytis fragariae]KAF5876212.1 hypothetical protein Bfra_002614 [Botrytis fragariae]
MRLANPNEPLESTGPKRMNFICVTLRSGGPTTTFEAFISFQRKEPEWIWESRSAIVHGKTGEQGVIKALRGLPFNHRRRPKQEDNTALRFCWYRCILTCGNTY